MNILGVKIDEQTKSQALEKAREFLHSNKSHKIFTPNPEMLVDAQKDADFKAVLNRGDMNLCDGFGLWLATGRRTERISGVDFMLDLCSLAEKENKSIYLLGSGSDEVVKKTADVLQVKFPLLKIVGYNRGQNIIYHLSFITYSTADANDSLIHDIILRAPDILFVAFGHGKQEKWIDQNLRDLPSVKIAMGVGGAFDFISGKVKRAPKFVRKIGLEWLWRLILQPGRFARIWKATVSFSIAILRNSKKQDTNK
jgi:N-acetylglucosaminyldiphosphoundecaprenol N-acetyl-beta-D-mannosaminyltransferase